MAIQIEIKGLNRFLTVLDWAIARFEKESTEGLMDVAKEIEEKAKRFVRVRTGALRDSITAQEISELEVAVSMLFYGYYLEYGTSRMPPYPFIRPALEQIKPHVSKTVWNHLGKLFHK